MGDDDYGNDDDDDDDVDVDNDSDSDADNLEYSCEPLWWKILVPISHLFLAINR